MIKEPMGISAIAKLSHLVTAVENLNALFHEDMAVTGQCTEIFIRTTGNFSAAEFLGLNIWNTEDNDEETAEAIEHEMKEEILSIVEMVEAIKPHLT